MSRGGPLEGRRVVVTRGVDKTDQLPGLLQAAGATVVKVPLIAPVALASDAEIRSAVARLTAGGEGGRRWLLLTSETAVAMVIAALDMAALGGTAVGVVGPATAAALHDRGIEAAVVAPGQEAGSLAAELAATGVGGARVLVIAAGGGRQVIGPLLAAAGARVEVLEAYRTVMPHGAAGRLRAAFAAHPIDAITFTSGSTVRHCAIAFPQPPARCVAICIGPVTARAAGAAGWSGIVTAVEHTAAGVVAAAVERLSGAHPLP